MGVSNDNEKIDALNKIEKAKELLDMGAITQEEFDSIKNKYLTLINESISSNTSTQKNEETISDEELLKRHRAHKRRMGITDEKSPNAAAREATKGIMRGIFNQMK